MKGALTCDHQPHWGVNRAQGCQYWLYWEGISLMGKGVLPSEIDTSGSTSTQTLLGRESTIWKLPCLKVLFKHV